MIISRPPGALRCATLFILSAALATFARAAVYYVDAANGNDSSATPTLISTPWATISKAANTMVAGDTVLIRGGTYRETVTVLHSGTAGNLINFQAYPGETPVITGADVEPTGNWTWNTGTPNAWRLA